MDFKEKEYYSFNDLVEIVKILRSPGGCPWDREQTHKSIRANFIEETYEAVEAIDLEDTELLREELGDVLLQVVFHSRIEEEKGSFAFGGSTIVLLLQKDAVDPASFPDCLDNGREVPVMLGKTIAFYRNFTDKCLL